MNPVFISQAVSIGDFENTAARDAAWTVGRFLQNCGSIEYLVTLILRRRDPTWVAVARQGAIQPSGKSRRKDAGFGERLDRAECVLRLAQCTDLSDDWFTRCRRVFKSRNVVAHCPFFIQLSDAESGGKMGFVRNPLADPAEQDWLTIQELEQHLTAGFELLNELQEAVAGFNSAMPTPTA